jgi:alpha-tubulin suppressor-like RCC1 family protein
MGRGQLGNNDFTGADQYAPVAVSAANGTSALFGKTVVALAAGLYHSLALCSDGTMAAWGWNQEGELGNDDSTRANQYAPAAVNTENGVSALFGKTVAAIAAGGEFSLALCSDGTVTSWGFNVCVLPSHGSLG